jgi:hypothetical protein
MPHNKKYLQILEEENILADVKTMRMGEAKGFDRWSGP